MNSFFRKTIGLGIILAASSPLVARTPSAKHSESNVKITVRIYNFAHAPQEVLAGAQQEAAKVFRKAGIETLWLVCALTRAELEKNPACKQRSGPADLTLRILSRSMAERHRFHNKVFGVALMSGDGAPATVADLFYHRVEELAKGWHFARARVLAHTMAHEIGHLPLGTNAHFSMGIMRAKWGEKDLLRAARGNLNFTPKQAARMQAQVLERLRELETTQIAKLDLPI